MQCNSIQFDAMRCNCNLIQSIPFLIRTHTHTPVIYMKCLLQSSLSNKIVESVNESMKAVLVFFRRHRHHMALLFGKTQWRRILCTYKFYNFDKSRRNLCIWFDLHLIARFRFHFHLRNDFCSLFCSLAQFWWHQMDRNTNCIANHSGIACFPSSLPLVYHGAASQIVFLTNVNSNATTRKCQQSVHINNSHIYSSK